MQTHASDRENARLAGERAIRVLEHTGQQIKDMNRYGFGEMFFGGFLAGGRHARQSNEAKNAMKKALDAVEAFRDLLDRQWLPEQQWLDLGEFIRFTQHFIEQPMAEWTARSRIDDARIQAGIAAERIKKILGNL